MTRKGLNMLEHLRCEICMHSFKNVMASCGHCFSWERNTAATATPITAALYVENVSKREIYSLYTFHQAIRA